MAKFLWSIIVYLSICIVIAAGIIYLGIIFKPAYFLGTPTDYVLAKYQYQQAENKSSFKNIIVGDSRGNADINPAIIGTNWLNLSIPGSEVTEGFITLKHYLKENKVDTLIMFYGYEGFNEGLTYFEQRTIPWQFPTPEDVHNFENTEVKIDREINGNGLITKTKLFFKQASRYLRYNHFPLAFQKTFIDGVMNMADTATETKVKKILTHVIENRGQLNFGQLDSCDSISFQNLEQPFSPKLIQFAHLDSIINLAAKNNIYICLMIPPMNQATWDLFKNSVYRNTADPYLQKIMIKYPTLHFITQPHSLPNSLFGDALHLNKRGTIEFSKNLRNWVK